MLQDGWSEPNIMTYLLLPLTALYRCSMLLRKYCYSWKIFSVYDSKLPVIVVGNISVGGTGKTPLTMAIVEKAREMGFKPSVVSRGYGGQALEWPQLVTPRTNAYYVGDEAVLIAKNTQCPVAVGPNRDQSIELLIKKTDCDLIISDDGLQHYALSRDVEIAVVDQQRRHLNQFCLPAGPLREPESRLNSVDLVMNHVGLDQIGIDPAAIDHVTMGHVSAELGTQVLQNDHLLDVVLGVDLNADSLNEHFQKYNDAMFYLKVKGFVSILDEGRHQIHHTIDNTKVIHAVAGIGHPARFFRLLSTLGYQIVEHSFADHHRYVESDFDFGDDATIVMTAKDAVKCLAFAQSNWYFLEVQANLNDVANQRIEQLLLDLQ